MIKPIRHRAIHPRRPCTMGHPAATRLLIATGATLLTSIAFILAAYASRLWTVSAQATPTAYAAHTLRATDTAHLHYLSSSGSQLVEEGPGTGTLPATVKGRFEVSATMTGTFTILPRSGGGTIRGHATATLNGSNSSPSFAGTLTVTGGTGLYAHAHGTAGLYGVFYRRTYALTVQTTGTLHY
jgi:hypothetical protein